ncbi:hypothetical protein [Dyadobacter psychrotolerans]|uniref:Uncharacterized protein n=1 Tax=Dyadobacter psychrotolerans TaxID=2541721 RepID=A0A4V2Z3F5_9BACT|nr:hypothetical protein [Dyadobacter psychrotolerans]TDE12518.1 hypothetical protein E0F88_22780 [Dyadobacter psychrotolerans]
MIINLLTFYRNPFSNFYSGKLDSIRQRLELMKNLYLICILANFIIVLIISLIVEPTTKSLFNFSISDNLKNNQLNFRNLNSELEGFLKTSLFGPFEEEIAFRLILITKSSILRLVVLISWIEYFLPECYRLNFFSSTYNLLLGSILILLFFDRYNDTVDYTHFLNKDKYNLLCWT